jgi:hypothetical protein
MKKVICIDNEPRRGEAPHIGDFRLVEGNTYTVLGEEDAVNLHTGKTVLCYRLMEDLMNFFQIHDASRFVDLSHDTKKEIAAAGSANLEEKLN